MGLPQILIRFKTAGGTAIRRSARGQVVVLITGNVPATVEADLTALEAVLRVRVI